MEIFLVISMNFLNHYNYSSYLRHGFEEHNTNLPSFRFHCR